VATFAHKCALLAELYSLQNSDELLSSQDFISYRQEFSFVLVIAAALTDEIVEATPSAENLIFYAFDELAELLGMSSESLGEKDSIRDTINFRTNHESKERKS
jgi:hypothetical protein